MLLSFLQSCFVSIKCDILTDLTMPIYRVPINTGINDEKPSGTSVAPLSTAVGQAAPDVSRLTSCAPTSVLQVTGWHLEHKFESLFRQGADHIYIFAAKETQAQRG